METPIVSDNKVSDNRVIENKPTEARSISVLGFTADDLAANRDGKISDSQKVYLRSYRLLQARAYFVFGLFLLLIAAVPGLRYFRSTVRDGYDLLGAVVFFAFALLLIGLGVNRWRRVQKDIQNGVVNNANGTARLHIKRAGRGHYEYKLRVEGQEFDLSKDTIAAFTEGQSYRVYYTPLSKVVLSSE
jgi:hypothetical protein